MTWHTVERAVFDNNGEWCEDMYGSGYFIKDGKLFVHVLLGQGKTETRYICTKSEFIQKRNRMLHEAFFGPAPHQNLNAVKREAWIKGYQSTGEIYHGENTEYMSIVSLASQRYPDKDGK